MKRENGIEVEWNRDYCGDRWIYSECEEGGTTLRICQIQEARLIAHTRDRGVRNEITLPQGMIAIQSNNLTSINTMNLTYNCVLTYI